MNLILNALQDSDFQLHPPAEEASIRALEATLGCALQAQWREFLLTADGATQYIEDGEIHAQWLSCEDIIRMRAAIMDFLAQTFGENWQTHPLENAEDGIANTLLHPLWLPFYRNEVGTFCLDHSQAAVPVIMLLHPDEDDEGYMPILAASHLNQWLDFMIENEGLNNDNLLGMVEDLMDEYGILDESGEFVAPQAQYNAFDHIGFAIHSESDFAVLLETLQSQTLESIETPNGYYYCYRESDTAAGISLWVSVNQAQDFNSLEPHFFGDSRRRIHAHRYLNTQDNPFVGCCYAWAQAEAKQSASEADNPEGLYPLLFNLMGFDHIRETFPLDDNLNEIIEFSVQLTAFPHRISLYADEKAFTAAERETPYAAQTFIPIGLMQQETQDNAEGKVLPTAYISGSIKAAALRENPLSGEVFYHLVIDSYGGAIDLLAHPDLFPQAPAVGNIVETEAWLNGMVVINH